MFQSDVERNQKIHTDGCLQKTFDKFLNQDNLILLVCVGGAMVLLQVSVIYISCIMFGFKDFIAGNIHQRLQDETASGYLRHQIYAESITP